MQGRRADRNGHDDHFHVGDDDLLNVRVVHVRASEAGPPRFDGGNAQMPGVVGDAALMVDPLDIQSIVEGLKTLASNPRLASELVDKGRVRKRLYTWEGSAERVWNVLTSV